MALPSSAHRFPPGLISSRVLALLAAPLLLSCFLTTRILTLLAAALFLLLCLLAPVHLAPDGRLTFLRRASARGR
ncbi:hypothetical protein HV824_34000 [Myxococcus sp. AM009]|uniref:hypothetical protein n=1 Tax=unclassified Myxococcus TaxID=2648731 RepID=UPI0015956F5D|nr:MULTISPECIES: hypothetical protein [unclassified Myxococcus]NVJ03097.1 hypothetical protein [Myxococcus sp. AM009]NVJ19441.1 hypothetical protein [Myxococcus sp. AM010]